MAASGAVDGAASDVELLSSTIRLSFQFQEDEALHKEFLHGPCHLIDPLEREMLWTATRNMLLVGATISSLCETSFSAFAPSNGRIVRIDRVGGVDKYMCA